MSKAIRSYPKAIQKAVIEHRLGLAGKVNGLGVLSALDAKNAVIRKEIVKTPA
jgi:hypothetical protein